MSTRTKKRTVIITGASAGIGRATAWKFAKEGWTAGLVARSEENLEEVEQELEELGADAMVLRADVADYDALQKAADAFVERYGTIDVWVNDAMATIFAPVKKLSPEDVKRATEVTYLGTAYGTMIALHHMRKRNRGTIIQVGSALSYRAIPLQAPYCAAKFAIRGFTDALRSELIHDNSRIHLTMVQLPGLNTPQFSWGKTTLRHHPQPVPPIFQPELAADAIWFAAHHHRREILVGWPTVKTVWANKLLPGFIDRILASKGYSGQMTDEPINPSAREDNLYHSPDAHHEAHGEFDYRAKRTSVQWLLNKHRNALITAAGLLSAMTLKRRMRRHHLHPA